MQNLSGRKKWRHSEGSENMKDKDIKYNDW